MKRLIIGFVLRIVLTIILYLAMVSTLYIYAENTCMSSFLYILLLIAAGLACERINDVILREYTYSKIMSRC